MVKLRVAVWPSTPPFDPWTTDCFQDLPEKPCPKPGYEIEPFLAVMNSLGWSYEWVIASESGDVLDDGNITGAMGMVQRGEVDVAANVMRMTHERLSVVDFSVPVQYLEQVYFLVIPDEFMHQSFILRTFDFNAWLTLFVFVASFIFMWALSAVFLRNYSWKVALIRSFHRHLIIVSNMESKRASGRPKYLTQFFSITLFVLSFVILQRIYQSVMSGMLAVSLVKNVPFTSSTELIDLLRQGAWHLIYPIPSVLPNCFHPKCSELDSVLLSNPIRILPFGSEFEEKINKQRHIYFGQQLSDIVEHPFSLNRDNKGLGIIIRDDSLIASPAGFIFPKNSIYRKKFDERLYKVFGGIHTMVRSYKGMTPYPPADLVQRTSRVRISLLHLYELFMITLGAYAICGIIFVLEILVNWRISVSHISSSALRISVQNWVMQTRSLPDSDLIVRNAKHYNESVFSDGKRPSGSMVHSALRQVFSNMSADFPQDE